MHLDGYNLLPYLTGEESKSPRASSSTSPTTVTWSRCGTTTGSWCSWSSADRDDRSGPNPSPPARAEDVQPAHRPVRARRLTSNTYWDWLIDHVFLLVPAQGIVGDFLGTFQEFPPRQKAASFTVDQVMEKLQEGLTSKA